MMPTSSESKYSVVVSFLPPVTVTDAARQSPCGAEYLMEHGYILDTLGR